MTKVIYTGYFVDDQQKLLQRFPIQLIGDDITMYAHHLTKMFRPPHGLQDVQIGRKLTLHAYAQVVTDDIQAILLQEGDEQLSVNPHPHITIATRAGVPPTRSNEVIEKAVAAGSCEILSQPVAIEVTEGYFDGHTIHI